MNFTEGAKRLTNVFKKNCGELDSEDDTLLFYTEVGWLYELNNEMKKMFWLKEFRLVETTFYDLKFNLQLAYLIDFF